MSPGPIDPRQIPAYNIPASLPERLPIDAMGCLITHRVNLVSRAACIELPFESKSASGVLLPCSLNRVDRSYWLTGEFPKSGESSVRLLIVAKYNALDTSRLPGKPNYECVMIRSEANGEPNVVRREPFRFMLEHVAGVVDQPIQIDNSVVQSDYYALAEFNVDHENRIKDLLTSTRSLKKPPRYDLAPGSVPYSPRPVKELDEFE